MLWLDGTQIDYRLNRNSSKNQPLNIPQTVYSEYVCDMRPTQTDYGKLLSIDQAEWQHAKVVQVMRKVHS